MKSMAYQCMWSNCYSENVELLWLNNSLFFICTFRYSLWCQLRTHTLLYVYCTMYSWKTVLGVQFSFAPCFTSTLILVTDDGRKDDSALPHLSRLPILPVDGTKWLRRPAFLFTCSYLLAVAQDSLFITRSRMNCKLQLNILSHHFPL